MTESTAPAPRYERAADVVAVAVIVLFVAHRLAVLLSAGDFLYPLEPSEAKNSQIAWDLMTGRFGTQDFGLKNYVANSGSIHHGSYSSMAICFWMVSRVFGYGLVSIRLVPFLFSVGALIVWMATLRRTFGPLTAACAGIGLLLVPTLFVAFQLTFLGCHPESVFPLALALATWLTWMRDGGKDRRSALLFGLCAGYAAAFSYLLWPMLALMGLLALLPPRVWPDKRGWVALAGGLVVGLWPIWVILLLGDPSDLFGGAITEREETTMTAMATGSGLTGELYWQTVWDNLPAAFHDWWMNQRQTGAPWGGVSFEPIAYRLLVFAPLVLLPWAVTEREPSARRLLLMIGIVPTACYLWLAFASPWKPHVPMRYFMPFALFGFAAPGVMIGVGWKRAQQTAGWKRAASYGLAGAATATLLWLAPPRIIESLDAVRLNRADELIQHRYVTYYNLGIGTVWAEQVHEVNDLIDVLTVEGDPRAFDSVQAGLWGSGRRLALGEGDWEPPMLNSASFQSGLNEWGERNSYVPPEQQAPPALVARNVGWGAGIRARWDVDLVAGVARAIQAEGTWPSEMPWSSFWEGFGFGWGRTVPDIASDPASLPASIPQEHRADVARGIEAGRALGEVPKAPRKPDWHSVRGPAT